MFDFFRSKMKLFMGILFIPLVIGFVLFGVQGYDRFRGGNDAVAQVGGAEISRQDAAAGALQRSIASLTAQIEAERAEQRRKHDQRHEAWEIETLEKLLTKYGPDRRAEEIFRGR